MSYKQKFWAEDSGKITVKGLTCWGKHLSVRLCFLFLPFQKLKVMAGVSAVILDHEKPFRKNGFLYFSFRFYQFLLHVLGSCYAVHSHVRLLC